jgi:hypothetical protein
MSKSFSPLAEIAAIATDLLLTGVTFYAISSGYAGVAADRLANPEEAVNVQILREFR